MRERVRGKERKRDGGNNMKENRGWGFSRLGLIEPGVSASQRHVHRLNEVGPRTFTHSLPDCLPVLNSRRKEEGIGADGRTVRMKDEEGRRKKSLPRSLAPPTQLPAA